MIDTESILSEIKCGAWIDGTDATDLARASDFVIAHHISTVSVDADAVPVVWPWLEGHGIKIMARITAARGVNAGSMLSRAVRDVFMHGADGAMVSLTPRMLGGFSDDMCLVRDDLFFNKNLTVVLDINGIEPDGWGAVLGPLRLVRADGLLLTLGHDAGDASDFVGRVYGLLNAWGAGQFDGELDFAVGPNPIRTIQASRLVQKMRPDIAERSRFYIPV